MVIIYINFSFFRSEYYYINIRTFLKKLQDCKKVARFQNLVAA